MNRLYTLYCGGNRPGGIVDGADFSRFLSDVVTPRFDGFTVRTSVGYWKGEAETVREVVIAANADDRYAVFTIAEAYARQFEQESVLLTTVGLLSGDFVS